MLSQEEALIGSLRQAFEEISGRDSLARIRQKAWDRFLEVGLPGRRDPIFRPLRLHTLYNKSLVPASQKNGTHKPREGIVFVNGAYVPELSSLKGFPKNVVILPLAEAMDQYAPLLNSAFGRSIPEEEHPFALLNTACQPGGVFLYIPPQTVIEEPIQVIHLVDVKEENSFLFPRLTLFLGKLSTAKFEIETESLSDCGTFFSGTFEATLEDGARLDASIALSSLPDETIHFYNVRAQLKRNSSFKGIHITNGGKKVHTDWRIALAQENAEADISGLYILKNQSEAHTHVVMDHQAPFCRSMQLFKGVLRDRASSSFDGKIVVQPIAQKTEAYQLNNNLVLSPDARAETKPNLKIFADDVKASHGATVGQLDDEQLLYLLTRGISKGKAEELLIKGFCQEVIQKIPNEEWQKMATYWEV